MEELKKHELELKELKKEYVKLRDNEFLSNEYKLVKMAIINERINELHKLIVKESRKYKVKYDRAKKKEEDKKEIENSDYEDYMSFRI